MTADVQKIQEYGGLLGRAIFAVLAVRIMSRRNLLRIFQWPGLVIVPFVFYYCATTSLDLTKAGIFLAGLFTVAQFSFWGNYLPLAFPLHLRGTGEGFAANVGGRMFGTAFGAITPQLVNIMPGPSAPVKFAYASAIVALFVYAAGSALAFYLPEPGTRAANE